MSAKILNQAQAEAVYSAMCALNNVSVARFQARFIGKCPMNRSTLTEVDAMLTGDVVIEMAGLGIEHREHYPNQAAFATAYGLCEEVPA